MTFEYPIWYIIISVIISGLLSYWLYHKNIKTSWKFAFMAFLRFIGLLILFITIGKLMLPLSVIVKEKPKLLLAFDNSISMSNADKLIALNSVYKKINTDVILGKFNVESVFFGSDIIDVDSVINKGINTEITTNVNYDVQTNFSKLENYSDNVLEPGDRLIIVSDGEVNTGNEKAFFRQKKYNISAVGIGDTNTVGFIKILETNFNKEVVLNNTFSIENIIETVNLKGTYKVEIWHKNKVLSSELVDIENYFGNKSKVRNLVKLKALKLGLKKYNIKIFNKEGVIAEKQINIKIVKNRGLVVINYKYPKPDIAFFKRVINKQNYKTIVSKNRNIKAEKKAKLIINFDANNFKKQFAPVVYVSKKNKITEGSKITVPINFADYISKVLVDAKNERIFVEAENLWKLNLYTENKDKENELEDFVKIILDKAESLDVKNSLILDYKEHYSDNENIKIEITDTKENRGEYLVTANVNIEGKLQKMEFTKLGNIYSINMGKLPVLTYSVRIYVDGKPFKNVLINVLESKKEIITNIQNSEYLKYITKYYNLGYYYNYNVADLLDNVTVDAKVKEKKISSLLNLIENWWFLLVVVLIFSLEWVLRKRNGLY